MNEKQRRAQEHMAKILGAMSNEECLDAIDVAAKDLGIAPTAVSPRRITFDVAPLVWISFRGERVSEDRYRVREDGGFLSRFLRWSEEQKIWPVSGKGCHSGGGSFGGAFEAIDAERVIAWLREQGAIEEKAR